MTRYKGRQSAKAFQEDFPHFVDMVVPLGGLGNRLDAMYDFHTRHGIKPQRGYGRRDENGSVMCEDNMWRNSAIDGAIETHVVGWRAAP